MSDQPYDQSAAQDAGYAAGEVQQGEQDLGNDARRDAQSVENMPEDVGRDIMDAPSEMANKIGNVFGGGERDADRAEGDVQNFGNQEDSSFNQGEQQGRQ
ncbi:hypothetical protein LTR62_004310 [Meristemomyces frigidus]|uniref:Uncharacterized protein n=1 Tax=Meristemomyces frigidus TaxID=1508187 RepID=A0AAN7YGA8_9PEZI|nr:hypothetical protein LTR62_004310 [Meristemomyces frigidus]